MMVAGAMRAGLACAALLLGGCNTTGSNQATLRLASGDVLRGGGTTRINGQFFVKNDRVNCYGSYLRSLGGLDVTLTRDKPTVTVNCSNGRTGTSRDPVWETGEAQVTFSDGSKGRFSLEDAP